MGGAKKGRSDGVFATNRKAYHDYAILSTVECGIALVGTEVKVVREGGVGLTGAYVHADAHGLWLLQANFPPYGFGNRFNHDNFRPRRLLAHKKEINRLRGQQEQKGIALVPLKLYQKDNGRIKLQVGLAQGKNRSDKREDLKRRDDEMAMRRAMRSGGYR